MISKKFLIILLAVFMIGIGISAFFISTRQAPLQQTALNPTPTSPTPTPTPTDIQLPSKQTPTSSSADETSNWKTYRSEKYGFELKYPPNWKVLEDHDSRFFDLSLTNDPGNEYFNIKVFPWVNDLHAEATNYLGPDYIHNAVVKDTALYNLPAIRVDSSLQVDGKVFSYGNFMVERGRYIFVIPARVNSSTGISEEHWRLISSTFKFIKSTVDTTDWKTYSGGTFEVKYPADLQVQENPLGDKGNRFDICNWQKSCAGFLEIGQDFVPQKGSSPTLILKKSYHYVNPWDCFKRDHSFSYYSVSSNNPVVNAVLSTFKFVSSTSSEQTSPTTLAVIPNRKVYRNDEFGFSLVYDADQQSEPNIFIDSTSTVSYDPVAESQFAVYLYRNPLKFHSQIYNSSDDTYGDLTYAPDKQQWVVASNSDEPTCPVEYTSSQGVPSYGIGTGFHAGASVTAYITDKGIVVLAGANYFSNDRFYDDAISFDNPQSVRKATYLVVKQ